MHKFEIESSGKLIHNACNKAFFCLLLSQFRSFIQHILDESYLSATIILVIFAATFTIYFYYRKDILNPEQFPDEKERVNPNLISRWWGSYSHPLVVKPDSVKHHQRVDEVRYSQARNTLYDLNERGGSKLNHEPKVRMSQFDNE